MCFWNIPQHVAVCGQCTSSGHPFDDLRNLPDRMIKTLFINLTESSHQLTKLRCQFLQKWSRRAAALNAAEKELHSGMPPHVQRVMEGKKSSGYERVG